MAEEEKCVQLKRSESFGFGFSILGGSGSELPPIIYDIVENSPAAVSGEVCERVYLYICLTKKRRSDCYGFDYQLSLVVNFDFNRLLA